MLEIFVYKKSACVLTSGKDTLNDILLLHLKEVGEGNVTYITVTGKWTDTCRKKILVIVGVPCNNLEPSK